MKSNLKIKLKTRKRRTVVMKNWRNSLGRTITRKTKPLNKKMMMMMKNLVKKRSSLRGKENVEAVLEAVPEPISKKALVVSNNRKRRETLHLQLRKIPNRKHRMRRQAGVK